MTTETITEPVSNTTTPIVDNSSEWLKVDQFRDVSIPDDYRKVSMFNRMIYTIDDDGVVAPKYNKVNSLIKTIDDLSLYDTYARHRRVSTNIYVTILHVKKDIGCSKSGGHVCVLGFVTKEFLENNGILEFRVDIEDLSEFEIVSLAEAGIDINDPQKHFEAYKKRVGRYYNRKLNLLREMDQFK